MNGGGPADERPMNPVGQRRQDQLGIARATTGFIYYVSVAGITGERRTLPPELVENVAWLRTQTELPICIGFGISGPEQIRVLAPVADGLIVGSALVRRVEQACKKPLEEIAAELAALTRTLVAALNPPG